MAHAITLADADAAIVAARRYAMQAAAMSIYMPLHIRRH